jgi:NADPH:quinone reductase-like Zn-dependent oxidoreductase
MKAIQLTKYGEPEEGLRFAEIPEPDRPKAGQILIRVEYAPINDNDMLLARGSTRSNRSSPALSETKEPEEYWRSVMACRTSR